MGKGVRQKGIAQYEANPLVYHMHVLSLKRTSIIFPSNILNFNEAII